MSIFSESAGLLIFIPILLGFFLISLLVHLRAKRAVASSGPRSDSEERFIAFSDRLHCFGNSVAFVGIGLTVFFQFSMLNHTVIGLAFAVLMLWFAFNNLAGLSLLSDVSWTKELIEGPPTFGVRLLLSRNRAQIAFDEISQLKSSWALTSIHNDTGITIFWHSFYHGHSQLMDELRRQRPDLFK